MDVRVRWEGGRVLAAEVPSGATLTFDSPSEGGTAGPSPLEAFVASAAACSAIDVLIVMEKKRQKVTSYHVEIHGERGPEGVYPRPFTSFTVTHVLSGEDLDAGAIEKAVQLSDEKYCSVLATLREGPKITSTWRLD